MHNINRQISAYWNDEEGAESIQTIVVAIVGLAAAIAVGWLVWRVLKGQNQNMNSVEEKIDTPTDDPFGDGQSPFK